MLWQGSVCFRDNLPENTTDDLCLGKADILQVDLYTTFTILKLSNKHLAQLTIRKLKSPGAVQDVSLVRVCPPT